MQFLITFFSLLSAHPVNLVDIVHPEIMDGWADTSAGKLEVSQFEYDGTDTICDDVRVSDLIDLGEGHLFLLQEEETCASSGNFYSLYRLDTSGWTKLLSKRAHRFSTIYPDLTFDVSASSILRLDDGDRPHWECRYYFNAETLTIERAIPLTVSPGAPEEICKIE